MLITTTKMDLFSSTSYRTLKIVFSIVFSLLFLNGYSQEVYKQFKHTAIGRLPGENPNIVDGSLQGEVTYSEGIYTWTVPESRKYRIRVAGAESNQPAYDPEQFVKTFALGAIVEGEVWLNKGDQYKILVGQIGIQNGLYTMGGGGGSFVWKSGETTPLIIAGGAGGNGYIDTQEYSNIMWGRNGTTTPGNGNGGGHPNETYYGSAGAGWFGDGSDAIVLQDDACYGVSTGGKSPLNGGYGGTAQHNSSNTNSVGGFGGGGGTDITNCNSLNYKFGGSGGGYTGGKASSSHPFYHGLSAQGGSSYIKNSFDKIKTSDGKYNNSSNFNTIYSDQSTATTSITNLDEFNDSHGIVIITTVLVKDVLTISDTLEVTYGDSSFNLNATSDSPVTITYSTSDASVATVNSSGQVTIVGAGEATITASQTQQTLLYDTQTATLDLIVNKKELTVSGVVVNDKQYNGVINGAVDYSGISYSGIVQGDDVSATYEALFESITVGTNKTVYLNGTLSGTKAGNYKFSSNSQTTTTASISEGYEGSSIGAVYHFTNAGKSGNLGPTQSQIDTAYELSNLNGQVTINTQGIQEWIVPETTYYSIEAAGARGGINAGKGAIVKASVLLNKNDVIKVLVGQVGTVGYFYNTIGSGGGGSFVFYNLTDTTPIIAAGGGGGGSVRSRSEYKGLDGSTGTSGRKGVDYIFHIYSEYGGLPGKDGDGGKVGKPGGGAGGGGWLTSGENAFNDYSNSQYTDSKGLSISSGGKGGSGLYEDGVGGFGGGGGLGSNGFSPAGGGGYSGGGGSNSNYGAGGGGSFITSSAIEVSTSNGKYNGSTQFNSKQITNLSAYNNSNGYVKITQLCTPSQLTVSSTISKLTTDDNFIITKSSISSGTISFTSSDSSIATINQTTGEVSIVGAGTVSLTVSQASSGFYCSSEKNIVLTVSKSNTSLTGLSNISKTYNDSSFSLSATSSSTGDILYTSSDTNVATISGTVVTIVGAGTAMITASQLADDNYLAPSSLTVSLTVTKDDPVLTGLSDLSKTYGDSSFTISATSSSTGAINYTSSNNEVVRIENNTVSIVGGGTAIITASQEADSNYNAANSKATFTVSKSSQVNLNLDSITKTYGDAPFNLSATSSSTGDITYSLPYTSIATISGTLMTIQKAGVVTITATQDATNQYLASSTSATLTVNRAEAQIQKYEYGYVYGTYNNNSSYSIAAPSGGVFTEVVFASYGTPTGALGDYTIGTCHAQQSASYIQNLAIGNSSFSIDVNNVNFGGDPCVGTVKWLKVKLKYKRLVNLSDQTVTYGDADFIDLIKKESFYSLNVSSSNTNVIDAFSVSTEDSDLYDLHHRIGGAGSAVITISQDEDPYYNAITTSYTITVNKSNVSNLNLESISKSYTDSDFNLSATSSSTGAISYSSSNLSVASVNGTTVTINGVGTAVITAFQIADANYNASSVSTTLTVSKSNNTNLSLTAPSKNYGDSDFNLTATSSSTGIINYSSSNPDVATIYGTTVSIQGVGTSIITVSQGSDSDYNASTITTTLTVGKSDQSILSLSSISKTYGDSDFDLSATSLGGGEIIYTSSNQNIASINGAAVTINGVGSVVITTSQVSDTNYNSSSITSTLSVSKSDNSDLYLAPLLKSYNDTPFDLSVLSNSNGSTTFSSSNQNVATINGSTVTLVGTGTAIITAEQASDSNYNASSVTSTLTVLQSDQPNLTLTSLTNTYGDDPFDITALSLSSGAIIYSSSNTNVVSFNGSQATIHGTGTSIITANQAADNNFNSSSVTTTITVVKSDDSNLSLSPITKIYGDSTFELAATSLSEGSITYSSSDDTIAAIDGSIVTIGDVGTAIITISQADDANYNSKTITTSIQVVKSSQSNLNLNSISKTYGDQSFEVSATSSSTGLIKYSSTDWSVATVSGTTITIVGTGSCLITATQLADSNYNYGTTNTTLTVSKSDRSNLDMDSFTKTYLDPAFSLSPTSLSSGALSYSSSDSKVVSVTGNRVSIVGPGTSIITVNQDADTYYNAATITRTITVGKRESSILALNSINVTYGISSINLSAASYNSSPIIYSSSNPNVGSISGSTVTINGAGTSILTAYQDEDSNYRSTTLTKTLTVNKANPNLSTNALSKSYTDDDFNLATSSLSSGAITYSSSNTNVAIVNGATVSIVGVGTSIITIEQEATSNYNSDIITTTLSVSKSNNSNLGLSSINKTYGDAPFNLSATTSSTGEITYSSSNSSIASVSGTLVTIHKAGTVNITATQGADSNYNTSEVLSSLSIQRATSPITGLSDITKSLSDNPFQLSGTSSNTSSILYSSSNQNIIKIFGNYAYIIGGGTAIITATQQADAKYNSNTKSFTIEVGKLDPEVSGLYDMTRNYFDDDFNINLSSESSGSVTFSSSDENVATISGSTVSINNPGSTIITAYVASTNNYNSATKTATLTVNKITTEISGFTPFNKTYGGADFELSATSSSTGSFSYLSTNESVATVSGTTVSIHGAGVTALVANQAADQFYNENFVVANLTVAKADHEIQLNDITKSFGDPSFTVSITSASTGSVTFQSSDVSTAQYINSAISIYRPGTVILTANQSADNNYNSATTTATLTITKGDPVIQELEDLIKTTDETNIGFMPESTSSGNITFSSSNDLVAQASGNSIFISGTGTAVITVFQEETDYYNSATRSFTLTVVKPAPEVFEFNEINITYGGKVALQAYSNGDGRISYTVENESIASYEISEVFINDIPHIEEHLVGNKAGSTILTFSQEESQQYSSVTLTTTVTINKKDASFSGISGINKVYDGTTVASVNSTAVSWTGLINGDQIQISPSGTFDSKDVGSSKNVNLSYQYSGDENYNISGQATTTATISKAPLVVSTLNYTRPYDGNSLNTSLLTINYDGLVANETSDVLSGTISFSGDALLATQLGTYQLTPHGLTSANYEISYEPSTITIVKGDSNLSLNSIEKTFSDQEFEIEANSKSQGGISYTSSNQNVATIVGTTVTIVGVGETVITANQEASTNFNSATATTTLSVAKADTTISGLETMTKTYGTSVFTLNASSTRQGAISYSSSNKKVATINGSTVTIVGAGTTVITANQAASENYNAATATATLTISKAVPNLLMEPIYVDISKGSISLYADSNSTGVISYSSLNPGVATINGTSLELKAIGSSTLVVKQEADANYEERTIYVQVDVSDSKPVISSFEVPEKTYGDEPFTLNATSNGTYVIYRSDNLSVISVSGSKATINGVGTVNITAIAFGANGLASNPLTKVFTVKKSIPTLRLGAIDVDYLAGQTQKISLNATSNSSGALTYSVSNQTVGTINGDVFTVKNPGSTMITVNQEETVNYTSSTTTASLTINDSKRKDPELTWKDTSYKDTYQPDLSITISATSSYEAPIEFSSSNTAIATISGSVALIKSAGSVIITAYQKGNSEYKSQTITTTLDIAKSNAGLIDFNPIKKTYGDASFSIEAKSVSTGPVLYNIYDNTVATNVNGGKEITIVGAGTARLIAIQKGDQNYNDLILYTTLTVDKAATKLEAQNLSAVYGDQPLEVLPTTNSTGAISLESSNAEVATISGGKLVINGAGTSKITIKQQASKNHLEATKSVNLNVAKKELTISGITVSDKIYDGTVSASVDLSTIVINGLIESDQLSLTTVGTFEDKHVGEDKTVFLTSNLSGTHLNNYSIELQETAKASITKKSIQLVGATLSSTARLYDGSTQVYDINSSYRKETSFVENDLVSIVGSPRFDSAQAGSRTLVQGSLQLIGSDALNYELNWTNGSGTIAKRSLKVLVQKHTKFEGQDDPVFDDVLYSGDGFGSGESVEDLNGSLIIARSNSTETVGSYLNVLTASGLSSNNYEISYQNGDFEIIPVNQLMLDIQSEAEQSYTSSANYTVSGSYASETTTSRNITIVQIPISYDSKTGIYSFNQSTPSGVVSGSFAIEYLPQGASGKVDSSTFTSKGGYINTGVYTLQPTQLKIESDFLNEEVSYKGAVEIKPSVITPQIVNPTKSYDGTASVDDSSVVLNGIAQGDDVSISYVAYYNNEKVATSKQVLVESIQLTGSDIGNYILTTNTVSSSSGIINPKALRVAANSMTKEYDGLINSNYSETYTGFIEGEDKTYLGGTLVQGGAATSATNVGTYGYSISGYSSDNYNISYESGELSITKAPLSVSNISVLDKTYDGTTIAVVDKSLTVFSGLVSGEEASLSGVTAIFESSQAGERQVRLSDYSYSGSTLDNYSITDQVTTTATIRKAPLQVVVNSVSTSYIGIAYQDFSVSYNGLVNDEDASVFSGELKFSGPATSAINEGTYQVSASGLINDNYEIEYVDGVYTITVSDIDGDGISDQDDTDIDGDGILNTSDADINGDGVIDNGIDTDNDGVNNANDTDDDNDGWIDIYELECGSDPLDAMSIVIDTDQDGLPNCIDIDDDNDGVLDVNDSDPLSSYETTDTDGDGIGNNADTDDDNDGQLDAHEISCGSDPLDANSLALDTDSDGIPNCVDTDDDNDGVLDVNDAFPLVSNEDTDTDGDGIGNNTDTDDDNDGFSDADELSCGTDPLEYESQPGDLDDDGIADCIDSDMDGDGVDNTLDAFPLNQYESVDTDNDGVGNNADADDDNDGVLDGADAFPLDASESADIDADGIGDHSDTDLYNDGFDDSRMEVSGALTPNQLGVESTWKITNLNLHPRNKVRVYDKNGVQVFSQENYQNDWRGTFKDSGDLLPSGTYYYKVYLYDTQQTLSGWLYLIY